ncbi:Lipoprotein [Frankia sp. AgKG'84/4]
MRSMQARFRGRTTAVAIVGAALGSALILSGCGQDFHQDGGVLPVPHSSADGDRHVTPAPVEGEKIIGPGYAPPRTAGPTQTAVPNLPGGKL